MYTHTGDRQSPAELLPTSVQKGYFMLSRSARAVLGIALRKYRPGRTDLISVGGIDQLKPALRLMTVYGLMIREVTGSEVLTSYTRWLECVQVKEGTEHEVYVAFSQRFERIWLESRKRLPEYVEQKPANATLRSQYSLRLYSWARKYVEEGSQAISLEELRRVFGLESIKDAAGNVIKEAPFAGLGELPATGARCRYTGDQHKDRLEDQTRVDGTFEVPPRRLAESSRSKLKPFQKEQPIRDKSASADVDFLSTHFSTKD